MIVRMFKPQFARLVESGAKRQTVRPTPKRMPKIGDEISLREWMGKPYRSKQRELCLSVVTKVEPIIIDSTGIVIVNTHVLSDCDRYAFVIADGFGSGDEFENWFRDTHGLPFEGVVIHWA